MTISPHSWVLCSVYMLCMHLTALSRVRHMEVRDLQSYHKEWGVQSSDTSQKVLFARPIFAQSIRSPYKLFGLFPHYVGGKVFHLLEFETVWGVRVENSSLFALVFKYFRQVMGQALLGHFLWGWVRGSTITIIMLMSQAITCGWVRAKGPTRSAPKQWKLDVHVKSYNPVSATSPLSKSKKEKL